MKLFPGSGINQRTIMEGMGFFFSSLFFAEIDIGNLVGDEGGSYMDQFMNMLFTLAIVLGLILLTLWVLKRLVASRNRTLNRSASIQILERRSLSPKSSLYLVQVDEKKILISDSPGGISLICDSFPQEQESFLEEEKSDPLPSISIGNKLKGFFVKNA